MNMPGFTAEASLYQTSEHFQMVSGQEGFAEQTVVPQNLNRCYWKKLCSFFGLWCRCQKVCNGRYTDEWQVWVGQCN